MNAVTVQLDNDGTLYQGEFGSIQSVQDGPTEANPLNVWSLSVGFRGDVQGTGGYSLNNPVSVAIRQAILDAFEVSDLSQLINIDVVVLRTENRYVGNIAGIADAYDLTRFVIF